MRNLTAADFDGRVGAVFTAATNAGPVELTLDEVTCHASGGREGGSFSLIFTGCASKPLGQGMRDLSADDFAATIFLVPVASKAGRLHYEAVFN